MRSLLVNASIYPRHGGIASRRWTPTSLSSCLLTVPRRSNAAWTGRGHGPAGVARSENYNIVKLSDLHR